MTSSPQASPSPLAYSASVLPTHTASAGGRVSEETESKAQGEKIAFQALMCGNRTRGLAQIRSPGNRRDMLREYH